jgi:hypothetical protein
MNQIDREQALQKVDLMLARPGGKLFIRYCLNMLGSIPVLGGAVSGAGSLWAEKDQHILNEEFMNWARLADAELNRLVDLIESMQKGPSEAAFFLIIAEVLGRTPKVNESIPVILNPATTEELQPYIAKGWLSLRASGAVCSMGCNNRIGNHVEDLKRPWGMGNGFVMTVLSWDMPQE